MRSRIAEVLLGDGVVIVGDLLGDDLLVRFKAEVEPLLTTVTPKRTYINRSIVAFYGDRVRQVTGMAAQSPIFATEILGHPLYDAMCATVLGPNCSTVQLNVAQVMERGPGAAQ